MYVISDIHRLLCLVIGLPCTCPLCTSSAAVAPIVRRDTLKGSGCSGGLVSVLYLEYLSMKMLEPNLIRLRRTKKVEDREETAPAEQQQQ